MTYNEDKYQSILNQPQTDADVTIHRERHENSYYNCTPHVKINWRHGWYRKYLNQIARNEDWTVWNENFTAWD